MRSEIRLGDRATILTSEELIREYTAKGWWGADTFTDLLTSRLRDHVDAVALVDPPNRAELAVGQQQRLTWAGVASASERLAGALVQLGLEKDDVLMVQMPNVAELVVSYLAAARIGAVVSPLPVQYRRHELRQVAKLAAPKAFVTIREFGGFDFVEMVESLRSELPALEHLIALGEALPQGVLSLTEMLETPCPSGVLADDLSGDAHRITADDIVSVCWTSGTEADPKGVPRSHNHWIWIAYATVDGCELDPGCNLLNPFPLINMAAIGGMLVPWLLTGGKLVLHHPLDLPVFLSQIEKEEINYTVAPPALLNMLLMKPEILAKTDLGSLKNIGSGSAPLSPWMVREWQERYGINVVNLFGSNEGAALTSGPKEFPDPDDRARYFPRFGVPGYEWAPRIAAQMSTKLVDPETRQVIREPGVPGELAIRSPGIFPGYFRRPDLTAKAFDEEGYFYTGDLFEIAGEEGRLDRYRFVSRVKDIIVRGGFKISPEEVEALVAGHPSVAEAVVIGYPDERLGEKVCLVAAPREGQSLTLEEVVEHLKHQDIAVYKLPEKLVVVERLPRNPLGKVLKRVIREQVTES